MVATKYNIRGTKFPTMLAPHSITQAFFPASGINLKMQIQFGTVAFSRKRTKGGKKSAKIFWPVFKKYLFNLFFPKAKLFTGFSSSQFRIQDGWVGSVSTATVVCHTPTQPELCILSLFSPKEHNH